MLGYSYSDNGLRSIDVVQTGKTRRGQAITAP